MMINETKLQIPDEYKEKIQVIYKDKDGYWAYLGYGLCWKDLKEVIPVEFQFQKNI